MQAQHSFFTYALAAVDQMIGYADGLYEGLQKLEARVDAIEKQNMQSCQISKASRSNIAEVSLTGAGSHMLLVSPYNVLVFSETCDAGAEILWADRAL